MSRSDNPPAEGASAGRLRLDGRTALITGGGRGIGRTVAEVFAGAGSNVVVVARSRDQVEAVSRVVESHGVRGMALVADVSDGDQAKTAAEAALEEFGTVDILVNNAGNLIYKPIVPLPGTRSRGPWTSPGPLTDEEWLSSFHTHVSASFFLLRQLVPGMLEQRWGRVISITSSARGRTVPFCAAYEMAKGALASLSRSLAHEWAAYNVTVNAIAPGHFHTTMSAGLHEDPKSREWMMKRIPMGREGQLVEVGKLALYLASEAAAYVTGQEVYIDGGESL